MDIRTTQLRPEKYFHIFNRGINGTTIFFEEKNYKYFLNQYAKYVSPFVNTYAYCLLGNHFHLLIRIKNESEIINLIKKNKENPIHWHLSNAFSSFLQGYTRAINKMYNRSGSLLDKPFKRIEIENEDYFSSLISYIHRNPEKHRLIKDFRDYPHSSYHSHIRSDNTKLKREEVLNWFGGLEAYQEFHLSSEGNQLLEKYLLE